MAVAVGIGTRQKCRFPYADCVQGRTTTDTICNGGKGRAYPVGRCESFLASDDSANGTATCTTNARTATPATAA